MAITFTNLGTNANPDINDATDLNSYSNSSWSPPSSGLIILFVFSRATSGTTNEPTVSGNNLTWTKIKTSISGTTWRVTLFGANASGSSTGATTIAFGGQTQFMCRASFFLAEGVDLTVLAQQPVPAARRRSGDGRDRRRDGPAVLRPEEGGVAVGEHAAVLGRQPVPLSGR